MKIYEVIFRDTRDPSGDTDAIFLVRAPDFQAAVEEVRINGSREHRSDLALTVYELGDELPTRATDHPLILRGPYFECAFNRGWREWQRKMKELEYTDEWEEV